MQIYKKGEATVTRTIAFLALLLLIIWGGKEFGKWLTNFEIFQKILVGSRDFNLPYYQQPVYLGVVLGIAMTVGAAIWCYRYLNAPRMGALLVETETELKKVSWPTREDTMQSTFIVMIFVAFIAIYLTGVEYTLRKIFDLFWDLM